MDDAFLSQSFYTFYCIFMQDRRSGRRGSTCQTLHKIPTIVQTQAFTLMDRTYIKKVSNAVTNMIDSVSLHPLGQDVHQEGEQCHHQHVRSLLPSPSSTDRTYINKVSNVIPNLSDPFSLHPHGHIGQDLHQEGEQCHHQHIRPLLPSPSWTLDRTCDTNVSNAITKKGER